LYLSDLSQIPKETLIEIKKTNQFDLLIIDSLHPSRSHPTHVSMKEAIEIAKDLKPKKSKIIM
jgi:phosphoribosyl 1,2-cyclic phosphodiesterase